MEAAEEPDHQKHNRYETQCSPEPTASIRTITVVTATPAHQNEDKHDYENCKH